MNFPLLVALSTVLVTAQMSSFGTQQMVLILYSTHFKIILHQELRRVAVKFVITIIIIYTKVLALLHVHDFCFRNFRYIYPEMGLVLYVTHVQENQMQIFINSWIAQNACSYRESLLKLSPERPELTLMYLRDSGPEEVQNFRNIIVQSSLYT